MNRRAFIAALGVACCPVPALPAPTAADEVLRELEAKVAAYNRRVRDADWRLLAGGNYAGIRSV